MVHPGSERLSPLSPRLLGGLSLLLVVAVSMSAMTREQAAGLRAERAGSHHATIEPSTPRSQRQVQSIRPRPAAPAESAARATRACLTQSLATHSVALAAATSSPVSRVLVTYLCLPPPARA